MIILGIETSCDETSASVVEDGNKVLSLVTNSSFRLHAQTGGIIPENAARKQLEYIIPTINQALTTVFGDTSSQKLLSKIDGIAVTVGHGLLGPLLVGVETAKTLSLLANKPLYTINHAQGHIYGAFLGKSQTLTFPLVALVVSGGHSDFYLLNSHADISWIAGTRDDAAGECFDKCARVLGLPYPGGPEISKRAGEFISQNPNTPLTHLPRPLSHQQTEDLSFSGLKTAVLRGKENFETNRFCAEIQEAIVEALLEKSLAVDRRIQPRQFVVCGGVASNKRLKEKFEKTFSDRLVISDPIYATDNAAMIASCAFYTKHQASPLEVQADANAVLGN